MDFDRQAVLSSFLAESEEGLDRMEQSLLELEAEPSNADLLNEMFRAAHTMKGNALSLDLTGLAELAHVLEDFLDGFREKRLSLDGFSISLILAAIDEFRLLLKAAASGESFLSEQQIALKVRISESARRAFASTTSSQESHPATRNVAAHTENTPYASNRTVRTEIERLDHMLNLAGEMVIAQGRVRNLLEKLRTSESAAILDLHRDIEELYKELQREIMRIRMVSIGPTFRRLKRSVRDISSSHGKIARLELAGADVEVDATVLEHLKDPLLHMIRNAIDHGLEQPAVRDRAGKDRCGLLKLSAAHENGSIVVRLEDDGAGFHRKNILEKARRMKLISESEQPLDQEVLSFVFQPGFSTAQSVTDLSGRGVGLDIVKRNIEALRGSVAVESQEGQGSRITLRLPLTLAIIDGLSVAVGPMNFIIPSDYISECLELKGDERNSGTSGILNLRGEALPYVRLRQSFQVTGQPVARENVVVVKLGHLTAGIAVDHLFGNMQAVIKPLGKLFKGVPGIAGSTILESGRVGLIVDVPGLLREVTPVAVESH